MLKIGICDDEKIWIEQMQQYLLKYSENFQKDIKIKIFYSAEDYLQKAHCVDILLLDIEMDKLSGIDLKEFLFHEKRTEAIIFISNYEAHIQDAFGKNVYGFLKKPISEEKLYEKLNIIISEKEDIVKIPVNNNFYVLSSDIIYVKAINKYVEIYTSDKKYIGYYSLKECEEKLPSFCFKRVQKSFIVNYEYVVTIKDFIEMDNKYKIKVSRGKIAEIKAGYMNYVRKRARN